MPNSNDLLNKGVGWSRVGVSYRIGLHLKKKLNGPILIAIDRLPIVETCQQWVYIACLKVNVIVFPECRAGIAPNARYLMTSAAIYEHGKCDLPPS